LVLFFSNSNNYTQLLYGTFSSYCINYGDIVLTAEFSDYSVNHGNIKSTGTFSNYCKNYGSIGLDANFISYSENSGGIIGKNAIFNGYSKNIEGEIKGNGTFSDNSNNYHSNIAGNGTFGKGCLNKYGNISKTGMFTETTNKGNVSIGIFNKSINYGNIEKGALFTTQSMHMAGIIGGTGVVFTNYSQNDIYGKILGKANFTEQSVNKGYIIGEAEFDSASANGADPPNGFIEGIGLFKGSPFTNNLAGSTNYGIISGIAIFYPEIIGSYTDPNTNQIVYYTGNYRSTNCGYVIGVVSGDPIPCASLYDENTAQQAIAYYYSRDFKKYAENWIRPALEDDGVVFFD